MFITIPFCSKKLFVPNNFNRFLSNSILQCEIPYPQIKDKKKIRKTFNIPFVFEPVNSNQNGWDGYLLRVGNLPIDDVLHEITHYIVAPKSRRKYPDFGLGDGFNSCGNASRIVSKKFAEKEEELVCVLQWVLMFNLGYKNHIAKTMQIQFWDNTERDKCKIDKHLKTLKKRYESNCSRHQTFFRL